MNSGISNYPAYSIIVPVYNGAKTLTECLTALSRQDYPPDRYEIIVVDDGSTDDTAVIAQQFPTHLIRLLQNQGRIVARNVGAREAANELLVFVDVRVRTPRNLLHRIAEIDYLPLMLNVQTEGGMFNRVLTLIRVRYYTHYPLSEDEAMRMDPILLDANNWRRMPKGATTFACTREMWLAAQPGREGKHVSDDTMVLEGIQRQKPILRTFDPTVYYQQREELGPALRHFFERGPRFMDYYLRRGGVYRRGGITLTCVGLVGFAGLVILALVIGPWQALMLLACFLLLFLLGATSYLARRLSDVPLVMLLLPLIVCAFGAGILWGVFMDIANLLQGKLACKR